MAGPLIGLLVDHSEPYKRLSGTRNPAEQNEATPLRRFRLTNEPLNQIYCLGYARRQRSAHVRERLVREVLRAAVTSDGKGA